ncbi:unnamed protein product [Cylindrotheca closterium]|uniref:Ubiquitin-like domain-containing protein n=1 Tax=Cylindrotheca closterium TaxID=2856 RepID=A0AAD2FT31_9STRA|nr:unnamed protein product [Cylindrotheca closterium]
MRNSLAGWRTLILIALIIACSLKTSSCKPVASFGVPRAQVINRFGRSQSSFETLRGGSTAPQFPDEEDGEDEEEEEEDDANEMEEEKVDSKTSISAKPVRLLVQTNWGNPVIDLQVELNAKRDRNVASLKKSLSRLLPGRPPIVSLQLVSEGRVLDDEMLVDELFDDEDEDEDEEEEETSKTLLLNSIPPVDPKFALELVPKLKAHMEDDEDTLTTEELLDAYFLNQVAIARNGQLLDNPEAGSSTAVLKFEMKEKADALQEQLKVDVPEEVWQKSLESVQRNRQTEEFRGQRYRSGKGGARTNLKKSIQHNLNIDWGETIRNFLLFLFFGYFGGKATISRRLMLLCAPLCFILQARPVKILAKVLFYMFHNPPGIVLSLLPAPQQTMLSMDEDEAYVALYGHRETGKEGSEMNESEDSDDGREENEE